MSRIDLLYLLDAADFKNHLSCLFKAVQKATWPHACGLLQAPPSRGVELYSGQELYRRLPQADPKTSHLIWLSWWSVAFHEIQAGMLMMTGRQPAGHARPRKALAQASGDEWAACLAADAAAVTGR